MADNGSNWRDQPSVIHPITSAIDPIDVAALFPIDQPVEIELGCGDGSFLTKYADGNPGINFIGVERLMGRLKKLDRHARRTGMTNMVLIRLEASYLLRYLLPPRTFTAIHVYFPDPWPKEKHHKNRLINDEFTERCRELIVPGGRVFLRTDHLEYFEQMEDVFTRNDAFARIETPTELKQLTTDFEREFNAEGILTNYSSWRLSAGS